MSFSEEEIRSLSAANVERNWSEIPGSAPASIVQHICEKRALQIGFKRAKAAPTTDDVRKRLTAIETSMDAERKARAEKLGRLIAAD